MPIQAKLMLKMVASRLSDYCETDEILPEEQCTFRPTRSTADMLLVVCRLQDLGRARRLPLYMCSLDPQKAYDCDFPTPSRPRSLFPPFAVPTYGILFRSRLFPVPTWRVFSTFPVPPPTQLFYHPIPTFAHNFSDPATH